MYGAPRSQELMTETSLSESVILHGSSISYFTGKMENYFRVRGIPYEFRSMRQPADKRKFEREVGLMQVPAVQLADGRWMTDSTKMIQWFESHLPDHRLIPDDPLQAFVCLLLEDWADEWWWRPAMHYRWHYPVGAHFASRHLAVEVLGSVPAPVWLRGWVLRRRQRRGYSTGDGITPANVAAVEASVKRLLAQLEAIFRARPFILGDRPSLADIGFSGPFFRHFALDPVPLEIIRQQAPAVLEWVARLWNTRLPECSGHWVQGIPEDLGPLLDDIGAAYLPYLCANADSVGAGQKRFDAEVDGSLFTGARYSRYRVWCLQELRDHYQGLPYEAQEMARKLLEKHSCWEPLWRNERLPLLPDQERGLPFRGDTKMVGANE